MPSENASDKLVWHSHSLHSWQGHGCSWYTFQGHKSHTRELEAWQPATVESGMSQIVSRYHTCRRSEEQEKQEWSKTWQNGKYSDNDKITSLDPDSSKHTTWQMCYTIQSPSGTNPGMCEDNITNNPRLTYSAARAKISHNQPKQATAVTPWFPQCFCCSSALLERAKV